MKMFVTFGHGQYGGVLANCYLEFEGEVSEFNAEVAVRGFMRDNFNGVWSFLYNEDQFKGQRQQYNLSRLAKLDMNGNIRYRMHDEMHCSFSTGMDGSITAGRGALDGNGYWEFPCNTCAQRAEQRLALDGKKYVFQHGYDSGVSNQMDLDTAWKAFVAGDGQIFEGDKG